MNSVKSIIRFHTHRNLIFRLPSRRTCSSIFLMQGKTGISRPCPAKTGAAKDTSRARTPASAASRAKTPASVAPRAAEASKAAAKAGAEPMSADAKNKASGELSAWLAKYGPVEREIIEAHERRLANRARRAAERREADARAFGDLCEATEGFAVVWRREGWSARDMARWADGDVLTLLTLARWLRGDATRFIDRARSRLRRPLYYAQERARREALARERRRVGGRRTTSPCPPREAILDAWLRRRESHEAAVRFGSMVHDLECYVDNSLLRDESGAIVGRRGGVKAWLQMNVPALYVRYTTVMRYKAMAKKLMQVTGLADPVPAAAVLAEPAPGSGRAEDGERDYGSYEIVGQGETEARAEETTPEQGESRAKRSAPELAVVRARAVWLEVVDGVRGSATALMERLDALTDSERVEDAAMLAGWRAKYENEITERMKSAWWRRMGRQREVR